ncbi:hypothetical protein P4630_20975, partial [Peribacillus simplex]|uniref:hypothetical protein n=1 Tax=Peribacillus simplex TaxID=1478 RepID=UPI002E1C1592|nr:hypothetical protein [Peribacillus simplex]
PVISEGLAYIFFKMWRDPIAIKITITSYPKTIKTSKMHKIFVLGVLWYLTLMGMGYRQQTLNYDVVLH